MNVALTGILAFLFLITGLLFRRFFYSEEFSKEYFKEGFFEVFLSAFFPSLIFYTIWVLACESIFPYNVDFEIIGKLLIAKEESQLAFTNLEAQFSEVLIFHLTLYVFSGISGNLFKKTVRYNKWDKKWKIFRYRNYWHYLVNAEIYEFKRSSINLSKHKVEDVEIVYVDALVETNEGTLIYDGILVDYELSGEGALNSLCLTQVERRYLRTDPDQQDRHSESKTHPGYYQIPGHIFVLSYNHIKHLNFTYYTLEKTETGEFELVMID